MAGAVEERELVLDGVRVFYRRVPGEGTPVVSEFVDTIWNHWDKSTRDATLALYRHADPDRLAAAGRDLDKLSCPALILWGGGNIYLPAKFADAFAEVLPDAEAEVVEGVLTFVG
jgi:pimeloyl-ACP methyl ester carboxylesterase